MHAEEHLSYDIVASSKRSVPDVNVLILELELELEVNRTKPVAQHLDGQQPRTPAANVSQPNLVSTDLNEC